VFESSRSGPRGQPHDRSVGSSFDRRVPSPSTANGFEPHASRDGSPVRSLGDLVYVGSLSYGRDLAPLLRALARSGDGNAQGPTLVYRRPARGRTASERARLRSGRARRLPRRRAPRRGDGSASRSPSGDRPSWRADTSTPFRASCTT
jgi:hypothetical protein